MKNIKIIILLLLFITAASGVSDTNVWVCNGSAAYAYHRYENCIGLQRCTGSITKVKKSEAIKAHRTPCKLCYKKNK